jgi:hypothetical protein
MDCICLFLIGWPQFYLREKENQVMAQWGESIHQKAVILEQAAND